LILFDLHLESRIDLIKELSAVSVRPFQMRKLPIAGAFFFPFHRDSNRIKNVIFIQPSPPKPGEKREGTNLAE
jgi:hypothetical protein